MKMSFGQEPQTQTKQGNISYTGGSRVSQGRADHNFRKTTAQDSSQNGTYAVPYETTMDEKHQKRIQQNYVTLLAQTNAVDLVPHLWENGTFSKNDKDRIENHLARHEQNTEFYNTILRKGNHVYEQLIQAMIATKQGHLAKLLVISEDEGLTESFKTSDEEMPHGSTRFKIRWIRLNDLANEGAVAGKEDRTKETEDSNRVQVKIGITGFTCEPIQMSMSRLDNVVKIKEYVEMVCGIDAREQALTHQNKLVSDEEIMEIIINASGSTAEVSFSVIPKFIFPESGLFSIEVVLFDEDSEPNFCLNVSGSDDIKKLKAMLRLSHPQNVPYYQLYLEYNRKECKEGYSMTEYGITKGSKLFCCVRKDYFLLRIRDTTSNVCFSLPVTGSMEIGDLNQAVLSHTRNVSSTMCELFYRGKRLSNEQKLFEIDDKRSNLSKTEMTLRLVIPGMILVSVRYMGNERSMDCYVRWNDKVLSLKQEVCEVMDIALKDHVFFYAGKTLEDCDLVHYYGINKLTSNATVFVYPMVCLVELAVTILISDNWQPTHFTIKVPPEATVKELKLHISWKLLALYPKFLVPDSQFYISVCDTEEIMDDDLTTIQSHGLKDGGNVTVTIQLERGSLGNASESFIATNLSSKSEGSFYLPDKGFMEYQSEEMSPKSVFLSSYLSNTNELPTLTGHDALSGTGDNGDSISRRIHSFIVFGEQEDSSNVSDNVDITSNHGAEVEDDSVVESKSVMKSNSKSTCPDITPLGVFWALFIYCIYMFHNKH